MLDIKSDFEDRKDKELLMSLGEGQVIRPRRQFLTLCLEQKIESDNPY